MGIYEKIESDMKKAMKAKDALRVSTLRFYMAAAKNLEIEKNVKRLEDADALKLIQKQIKQREDSIEQFRKGNRPELADKEARELNILKGYLPAQLEEGELIRIVEEAIKESGASAKKETGKVMKLVMDKVAGRADGRLVNQLVMARLK